MQDALQTRENAFCNEYILDRCATKAAIRAGYSKRSAATTGWRLLRRANVVAKIAELEREIAERAGLTAVVVREELRRICTFDPGLLYDEGGRLRPIDKLPPEVRACIAAIEYENTEHIGEDGQITTVRVPAKVRFWNKNQALEVAARITGLLKDPKVTFETNPLKELLERIGGRGSGLPYNGGARSSHCPMP